MNSRSNEPAMSDTAVPSPCTGVCRIDPRTGWCEGCQRSLDEIANWSTMSEREKRAVSEALAPRRTQAGARPLRSGPLGAAEAGCDSPQPGSP